MSEKEGGVGGRAVLPTSTTHLSKSLSQQLGQDPLSSWVGWGLCDTPFPFLAGLQVGHLHLGVSESHSLYTAAHCSPGPALYLWGLRGPPSTFLM